MRKTLVYILLLAVAGAGLWYFVFNRNKEAFSAGEADFAVKDTASVGKIYMVRTSGESVTLERKAAGWMVNGGYMAMERPVSILLGTLARQTAQYPVPENMHNGVVKSLSGNSVKVEVYDKSDKLLRVFYVGSEAKNYKGSFMLMKGAERPYVVAIQGFEGYLTPIYSTALVDWRERRVFDLKPEEIRSVSVQYVNEPLNSYTVSQEGDKLTVKADPGISETSPLNEARTKAYLKFFENVNAEGYLNGMMNISSAIAQTEKRCIVDVEGRDGKKQHLEVYWMPVNKRSKNLTTPPGQAAASYDADRFYGVMNDFRDTVIIQQFVFDKILRRAYEFYEPEQTSRPSTKN
jgi:hypothetical protein